jgi:hypothetical protein
MQGSIHKYSNHGELNNDRFTFDRFLEVAEELKAFISPDDIINVLEFGVNIRTPFDPTDFIKNLIAHRKQPFNKTIKDGMVYSYCEYNQNLLKIYNKGLQQGPYGSFILRIESKYLKMQKLFKNGLKWKDLMNPDTWQYLGTVLQKKFSEVIYFDPSINLKLVPESDRQLIEKGHNPFYWRDINSSHASRIRNRYQDLISKYGTKFNILPQLLKQEIDEVLAKSYQFSPLENYASTKFEKDQMVKSYPLLYRHFSPLVINEGFCPITGISISMQKKGSKFLCISGLKFLFENNFARFEKLKIVRLSKKWQNESLKIQSREIAHSIRNEYFNTKNNPRNNTLNTIKRITRDSLLFDTWQFISEDKRNLLPDGSRVHLHY